MKNAIKLKLGEETETIAGFLLWQVSKLWQQRLTLGLQDLGLPPTQGVLLANALRFTEEGIEVTQSILSKATKVDRMTGIPKRCDHWRQSGSLRATPQSRTPAPSKIRLRLRADAKSPLKPFLDWRQFTKRSSCRSGRNERRSCRTCKG